jgi:hypothetical protein
MYGSSNLSFLFRYSDKNLEFVCYIPHTHYMQDAWSLFFGRLNVRIRGSNKLLSCGHHDYWWIMKYDMWNMYHMLTSICTLAIKSFKSVSSVKGELKTNVSGFALSPSTRLMWNVTVIHCYVAVSHYDTSPDWYTERQKIKVDFGRGEWASIRRQAFVLNVRKIFLFL